MRALLTRLMVVALVLLPLVATARGFLGAGGERLAYESPRAANFAFYLSSTTLQTQPAGWLETLFALPLLLVETLRPGADAGWSAPLFDLSLAALVFGAIWFALASYFSRRPPFVPLLLLLALQAGGLALIVMQHRAPPISLQTPYTIFAVVRGDNASAQIARLEKQGVGAVALAGEQSLPASELAALQKAHPRVLIANGFVGHSDDGTHFTAVGVASTRTRWPSANEAARDIESRGGAMIIGEDNSRDYGRVPASALVAILDWSAYRAWRPRGVKNNIIAAGTSGAAWTLLPRGLKDGGNVVRALRLGKAQPLFARGLSASQSADELFSAFGSAWRRISGAGRAAALLSLVALVSALWLWSANGAARREAALSGPQRAVGYLRKRRFIVRGSGAAVLSASLLGSVLVVSFMLPFALALLCWLALDALFFYGYRLWRYTP